jgi:hypothetical protein
LPRARTVALPEAARVPLSQAKKESQLLNKKKEKKRSASSVASLVADIYRAEDY